MVFMTLLLFLMPQDGRRVRILSERFRIPVGKDGDHPVMEVVYGVIEDRAKAPVVFFARLVEIDAQPFAKVLVFSAKTYVGRTQKLDVLHSHFGHAVRAAMQIALVGGQSFDI